MDKFFLYTVFEYGSTGIPARTHIDCDEIPTVTIYSAAGIIIETPVMTKFTEFYPLGHYKFTLNGLLYTLGDYYYYVVRYLDQGDLLYTEREYFRWGFISEAEGDIAFGYNRNLFRCIETGIKSYTELITLCPNLKRASAFLGEGATYPVLVVGILPQSKIPGANPNIATMRRTFIRFRFYHSECEDTILIQLNDMLNTFLTESDDYDGYKFQDGNDVFFTFSLIPDVFVEDEPGVVWDDVLKLWRIGSRYIHDGSCH
jgi:hypothetical protein